jgi:cytidylate kinase
MSKGFSIAIDGPVAAGKGTIAPALAQKLNGFYLDTGAMYRCVVLYCLNNNVNLDSEEEIIQVLSKINIDFKNGNVLLNDQDVTSAIRQEKIDNTVSIVAGFVKVRRELILRQQNIAQKIINSGKVFIAEGRDMGTGVLPNADFKIFLTADPTTRAMRRLKQKEKEGRKREFDKILEDVKKRDYRDTEINKTLVKNPENFGYLIIDNSDLSEEETIKVILSKIK